MNRELKNRTSRRTMSRRIQYGGGYGMGAPIVSIPSGPGSDWNFTVKEPVNQGFDDCLFPARPGQLFNTPNPALAQAGWPLRGGRRTRRTSRAHRGGAIGQEEISLYGTIYEVKDLAEEGGAQRIVKYTITDIGNNVVTLLPQPGAYSDSEIIILIDSIINNPRWDTQLGELQSRYPDAVVESAPVVTTWDFAPPIHDGTGAAVSPVLPPPTTDAGAPSVSEDTAENENVVPVPQSGGAYDTIEDSHAYHHNGWNQELSHGGSSATSWGRDSNLIQTVMAGGRRRRNSRVKGRAQRGGGCPCTGSRLFGGSRRRHGSRRQQMGGASYGYAINPSVSIGGNGPNVDAIRTGVPCDPPAGSINSSNPQLPLDPRAYGVGYSATPNTSSLQTGGAYSTGNAFPNTCYKAPGSELPVYNAQTAGFTFNPSTAHNGALPDGVTPYNDVVPYAARMGGARRRSRKAQNGRKGSKRRNH